MAEEAKEVAEVPQPAGVCWKCKGCGTVRKNLNNKWHRRQRARHSGGAKGLAEATTNGGEVAGAASEDDVVLAPCSVCGGTGKLERKRKAAKRTREQSKERAKRAAAKWAALGWVPRGPVPPAKATGVDGEGAAKVAADVGEDVELTSLCGHWGIFQPLTRHRFSTDDVVTAWYACLCAQRLGVPVRRHIDLGTGLGSVLMMTAWRLLDQGVKECQHVGVEAQKTRASLAKQSVVYNGISDFCAVRDGDLRDLSAATFDGKLFDLVTGTPPYFPVAQGGLPPDAESARCLFEFRGGIEAYCAAAKEVLAPGGIFVVVETAAISADARNRVSKAAAAARLDIVSVLDTIPKTGKVPLFSVWTMKHADADASTSRATDAFGREVLTCDVETVTVRGEDGEHTAEYVDLLDAMGFPVKRRVPASS